MAIISFCQLLTLQIGVALLAVIFLTLSIDIMVVNYFEIQPEQDDSLPISYIVIGVYTTLILLTGLFMFFAAYKENQKLCWISLFLLVLLVVLFVIGSAVSFYNNRNLIKHVCALELRCPESLWLAKLRYRCDVVDITSTSESGDSTSPLFPTTPYTTQSPVSTTGRTPGESDEPGEEEEFLLPADSGGRRLRQGSDEVESGLPFDPRYRSVDDDNSDTKYVEDVHYQNEFHFGVPFIIAVLLFLVNLSLFTFTIVIVWSYKNLLQYVKLYSVDPAKLYYS